MKRALFALTLLLLAATSGLAQTNTNPIRWTWIATTCDSWDCAAAAIAVAHGDRYVFAYPTGRDDHKWVVLKRVEEGSVYVPDDEPYACQVFDTVPDAGSAFVMTDSCHAPLIMSVPDGRAVVVSLSKCPETRRRPLR